MRYIKLLKGNSGNEEMNRKEIEKLTFNPENLSMRELHECSINDDCLKAMKEIPDKIKCQLCKELIILDEDNRYMNTLILGYGNISVTCNHCKGVFYTWIGVL